MQSWNILERDGYEIKIWTDAEINLFIEHTYPIALPAILNARNHAEASDIARYLIVHHYGGYYIDWDIRLHNVSGFKQLCLEAPNGYLLYDEVSKSIASEHFSAGKHEEYLIRLVKDIIRTYDEKERSLMETPQYSGPFRMLSALRRHPAVRFDVIALKDVFEYNYSEIRQAREYGKAAIMTHFWSHSWIGLPE
ncbi:glycosyltransferase [Pedobacter yulinensis]|nr:glycosyltransferase [Pedobacter yulinensis]